MISELVPPEGGAPIRYKRRMTLAKKVSRDNNINAPVGSAPMRRFADERRIRSITVEAQYRDRNGAASSFKRKSQSAARRAHAAGDISASPHSAKV